MTRLISLADVDTIDPVLVLDACEMQLVEADREAEARQQQQQQQQPSGPNSSRAMDARMRELLGVGSGVRLVSW